MWHHTTSNCAQDINVSEKREIATDSMSPAMNNSENENEIGEINYCWSHFYENIPELSYFLAIVRNSFDDSDYDLMNNTYSALKAI